MKYKNPNTGEFDTLYIKALDSMPVGTQVDFNGQAQDIPAGWQEVEDTGEIYSTDETRVGTWLGKPLYRKVIQTTGGGANAWNNILNFSTISSDLEKIINFDGTFTAGNIGPEKINIFDTTSVYYHVGVDARNNRFTEKHGSSDLNNATIILIVEYTKTTDTVGGAE